ncbi:MAG: efflux RND transporter periplasmic adaptor subunit [Desulfobaccales bacterium]
MWMRVLGSNKRAVWLAGAVILICLALVGLASRSNSSEKAAGENKVAAPPPVETRVHEISFMGKFSCPLKRMVILPFGGIITSLQVQAGQQVKAGEVLARYRLTPEAAMQLRRRLSPPQIKDLEMKLADVQRGLDRAAAKRQEISQLAAQKLASPQALAQAEKEWNQLSRQRNAVQANLHQEQGLASEDQQIIKKEMGNSSGSGNMLKEAVLKAPINGYVLFVHPDLRENAELEGKTVAFQVGVMDPLVVKGQVHEMESLHLRVGDLAEIFPESLPGRKFEARISRLSWVPLRPALEQPSYYEAEVQVPNPDLTLKEGMKVRIVVRKPR